MKKAGKMTRPELRQFIDTEVRKFIRPLTSSLRESVIGQAEQLVKGDMTRHQVAALTHELMSELIDPDNIEKLDRGDDARAAIANMLRGGRPYGPSEIKSDDNFTKLDGGSDDIRKRSSRQETPQDAIRKVHHSPKPGDPALTNITAINKLDDNAEDNGTPSSAIRKAHQKPRTMR